MSQSNSALISQINALKPRAGTQIQIGMKWAVAMLDPSFQSINAALSASNVNKSDPAFSARPAAYSDAKTLKTIVLMTDGENSDSTRINGSVYATSSHYAHWNNFNFNYYLQNYVYSWQRPSWYYTKYYNSLGNNLLNQICTAAKNNGIVIWTVGFEVTDTGDTVMRNCASSPAHFFDVNGVEITAAFQSIARQINQLKLTQ